MIFLSAQRVACTFERLSVCFSMDPAWIGGSFERHRCSIHLSSMNIQSIARRIRYVWTAHLKVQTLIIDSLIDYCTDGAPPIKRNSADSENSLKTPIAHRLNAPRSPHLRLPVDAYLQFSSLHRYRYRYTLPGYLLCNYFSAVHVAPVK